MDIDLLIESDGLFVTTLPDGISFTWRLLTLKEYQVFSSLRDQGVFGSMQIHSEVFDRCYVGDARAINGNLPAGTFLSIGELIMYLSGDSAGEERQEIEAARAAYADTSVTEVMKRIVLMAFSSYTPDVFETWTRAKLLRTFVMAEALLMNRSEYQPIDTSKIMTPVEAAKAAKKGPVDFAAENREFSQKDAGVQQHALDMHPSDLKKRAQKQQKITTAQARRLDRMDADIEQRKSRRRRR